jgi:antibiotic biosynthesis monooxygenase (ABM) superfamily enzyme
MKLALKIAFVLFIVSLIVTVLLCLRMAWGDGPSKLEMRILATSVIIMLATLFFIPVGEAMNRVMSNDRNPPNAKPE